MRSPGRLGIDEGCHHLAGHAERRQVTLDHEAVRAGFVDHVQLIAPAGELAQRLVEHCQITSDAAYVAHLAIAPSLGHGDVDLSL